MTKNLTLGLILTCLTQMWALKNFCGFYLYQILCIAASYHCVQLHGKVMSQASEKGKKPHFGSDFGPLDPNLGHHFFFQKSGFLRHYISWSAIIMYNIKKTNNSIFRKRSEGQMHCGETNRQTNRVISQDVIRLRWSVLKTIIQII